MASNFTKQMIFSELVKRDPMALGQETKFDAMLRGACQAMALRLLGGPKQAYLEHSYSGVTTSSAVDLSTGTFTSLLLESMPDATVEVTGHSKPFSYFSSEKSFNLGRPHAQAGRFTVDGRTLRLRAATSIANGTAVTVSGVIRIPTVGTTAVDTTLDDRLVDELLAELLNMGNGAAQAAQEVAPA